MMKKEPKNYAKRGEKEFNFIRLLYQRFITRWFYGYTYHIANRLEVYGRENFPKTKDYVVAANHLSTIDPPLIAGLMPYPVAFMAKKELFDHWFLKVMLDWLGTFAVNREKLEVSTIKTALSIKNTRWILGVFPQGTREEPGKITHVTKGFAGLAKATKCGILPVGITGSENRSKRPFSGKIIVRIGELIPYNENPDVMVEAWIEAIQKLTGYTYEPEAQKVEET